MALYNISNKQLSALTPTYFAAEGLMERQDLQQALKGAIEAIAPDCLVISEEFGDWDGSKRRIDLLAIDKNANLVVIELKRDETGAHMELQALRYAAMISTMRFEQACEYFEQYIHENNLADSNGIPLDARETILDFIDPSLDDFGNDVRIVLASADFGKELTTSVLWLREKKIDISCVRLTPYRYNGDVLINAEQIIPVPEAEDYQIKFREKRAEQTQSRARSRDYSTYMFNGNEYRKNRLALETIKVWINQAQPQSLMDISTILDSKVRNRIVMEINQVTDKTRYYCDDSIMLPSNEEVVISNQWGLDHITLLIDYLSTQGFVIEKVS